MSTSSVREVFGSSKPIIGMVHLAALPGSPRWGGSLQDVVRRAKADARVLRDEGADGILVENFGDVPFHPGAVPPETVASMAVVVGTLVGESKLPLGVNVLRNDARAAVAIAAATGARFVRINVHTGVMVSDQGILRGRAHRTLRARAALGANVAILADVFVKHAAPLVERPVEDVAEETVERGLADALVVTGPATGRPPDVSFLERIKSATPRAPVFVGSGVDPDNVAEILRFADGLIVGTSLKRGGVVTAAVDPARVRKLVRAARA
ncbi:MAG: BtpA/SgcQ family protein [Planctomycetes bacterium]|nr:BtpA/SgcQ family protein [Planctomycetota bacterium]MBI3846574.1 BtpA/SgcQ family protein [Planctomycetota bacterium]